MGDAGSGARIDHTAHEACVNISARLQAAGKVLGPAVIIGPAAALQASQPLCALGKTDLRSYVVGYLPKCAKLETYEYKDGWVQVDWKGSRGWVSGRYLAQSNDDCGYGNDAPSGSY